MGAKAGRWLNVSLDLSVSRLSTEGAACLEESLPPQAILSGNTSQTCLGMYLPGAPKYYQVDNQDCTLYKAREMTLVLEVGKATVIPNTQMQNYIFL